MSIEEVSGEQLAELLHHYYQGLGQGKSWEQVPEQEKSRLIAAAHLALMDLASTARERANSRRYFAKPGEAEWGC
jgi:hypothetical protein